MSTTGITEDQKNELRGYIQEVLDILNTKKDSLSRTNFKNAFLEQTNALENEFFPKPTLDYNSIKKDVINQCAAWKATLGNAEFN